MTGQNLLGYALVRSVGLDKKNGLINKWKIIKQQKETVIS